MSNYDNKYFKVELIAEKTWSINGQANDLMYLIEGAERAILIDMGTHLYGRGSIIYNQGNIRGVNINVR